MAMNAKLRAGSPVDKVDTVPLCTIRYSEVKQKFQCTCQAEVSGRSKSVIDYRHCNFQVVHGLTENLSWFIASGKV